MYRALRSLSTVLFLAALPAFAQTPSGNLAGRVTDESGAPIPDAGIQVRNVRTNEERLATSAASGDFTVANLAPGQYDVIVNKDGFRSLRETGLNLETGQTVHLNIHLQLRTLAESVEVKAAVPPLNTESPGKSHVFQGIEITEVPLENRAFSDLPFYVAGVARQAQGGQGSAFTIDGARADNTNFLIDGFSTRNPRTGTVQARPPLDTLDEFKIQTTGYSAEYGGLSGGVLNLVLKTGGNQPHGSLFELIRNDKLNARNFFDTAKSKVRRNQFGASLTGPVWIPKLYNGRDRTFFVFGWESYRQVLGDTKLGRVPSELERAGDFSVMFDFNDEPIRLRDPLATGACTAAKPGGCFPENRIPPSRIDPIAGRVLNYFPLPNRPGEANNYLINENYRDRWNSFLYKVDHWHSHTDNLSFRFAKRYTHNLNPFAGGNLGTFGDIADDRESLIGLTHTHFFSPVFIHEIRAGLGRSAYLENSLNTGRDFAAEFGISGTTNDPALVGFPRFTIRDLTPLGDSTNAPVRYTVNNIQLADTVTVVRSRHLFDFGAEILRTQYFQPYNVNVRGTFNFLGRWTNSPFADFLLGMLNNSTRQGGTTSNYLFSTGYGFFVEDAFKARSNLTFDVGVRYEITKPPDDKYGRLANFIPALGKIILADDRTLPDLGSRVAAAGLADRVGLARDYDLPKSLVYTNYHNFAPRFGFAWRPLPSDRIVMRGGYGIFYGSSMQNPIRLDLGSVYPFAVSQTFTMQSNRPNLLTLSNPFPDSRASFSGVTNANGYELHAPPQYLQSWDFTIAREIGWDTVLEASYVGTKGTHLGRRYDLNQPIRRPELRQRNGSFPRPFAGLNTINYYSFGSSSSYNAGMLTLTRRFSRGLFHTFNYVYGKSIDDASQISGSSYGGYPGAQDARNLKLERGRSDFDVRHALTMSWVYQLPFLRNPIWGGWQMAGTGRIYTGSPFTPRVSNADLNLGEANRPDRLGTGKLAQPGVDEWFDVDAFEPVPPGAYRFGNSGRNILDGPAYLRWDVALMKQFTFRESHSVEFRCEVFNLPNRANFLLPDVFINSPTGGAITSAGPGRIVQFGLRYQF